MAPSEVDALALVPTTQHPALYDPHSVLFFGLVSVVQRIGGWQGVTVVDGKFLIQAVVVRIVVALGAGVLLAVRCGCLVQQSMLKLKNSRCQTLSNP